MSLRKLTLLVFAVGTLADPVAATAAGGVHVDPGSPAGKEYAIPIEATRTDFGGGGGSGAAGTSGAGSTSGSAASSGDSAAPPLFGVGVTPATARTGLRPTGSRPGSKAPAPADAAARARAVNTSATVSTAATGGGIVAGMLLVALLFAFVFRRPASRG